MTDVGRQETSRRRAALVIALGDRRMWFTPPPEGLTVQAWRLFVDLRRRRSCSVVDERPPDPDGVGLGRRGRGPQRDCLSPAKAYAGFANAHDPARSWSRFWWRARVVKCGLGARIGHLVVSRFGRSTLGLVLQHLPRRRAHRPGVSEQHGALRRHLSRWRSRWPTRRARSPATTAAGVSAAFLMFSGIVEPEPLVGAVADGDGRQSARAPRSRGTFGVEIGFGSWLLAASVPTLLRAWR